MDCTWNQNRLTLRHVLVTDLFSKVTEILKHGSNSEYLNTLASLAINPSWTAAIFSSFEPIFVDICSRWMHSTLTQNTPSNVLGALARVLPFAPHLSIFAEEVLYRSRGNDLDAFISQGALGLSRLSDATLMEILLALTRLLEFDNDSFAAAISPSQLQLLLCHSRHSIRYLAIKVLCLFLHASESTFLEMIQQYIGPDEVAGTWEEMEIDYTFYNLWEEKRFDSIKTDLSECRASVEADRYDPPARVIKPQDLLESTACLAGVLLPSMNRITEKPSTLVMTKSTTYNMCQVAKALLSTRPILVTGLLGAGKTSIIREIAKALNKEDSMMTLYFNEQTDPKLLIGMYTSGEVAGSFSWRPGVLTTAVREGRWVIIEDLDRAPIEVISILLPLLKRGELLVPNLGGTIHASRDFRLFATIRSTLNTRQEEILPGVHMIGIRNWLNVSLKMLTDQDLQDILAAKYPILAPYQPLIMNAWSRLRSLDYNTSSGNRLIRFDRNPNAPQVLLRCCQRLQSLLSNAGVYRGSEPITESVNDVIFMEVVDCFVASQQSGQVRAQLIEAIAQELHFPPDRAEFCIQARIPSYENTKTVLSIGRVKLPKKLQHRTQQILQRRTERRPFAMTQHALRVCESISVSIKMREPCLLVGETGTGKTTIVQELAESTGHKLIVINLSQQSETGDLLGGYKPISLRALAIPMKEEFQDLLEKTWKSHKNQIYLKSLNHTIAKQNWSRTLRLWQEALRTLQTTFELTTFHDTNSSGSQSKKRRKVDSPELQKLRARWDSFAYQVEIFQKQLKGGTKGFAFAFAEGPIVKATRNGDWILLDEINLATPDTLESLSDLLYNEIDHGPSLLLSETGVVERVKAHPDFRVFAAMNPATDIGKRDLPISLRSRFTEYHIGTPDTDFHSLVQIVNAYISGIANYDIHAADDAVKLYLEIRRLEESHLLIDGAGQKPHFTLRTLTRTMTYVTDLAPAYSLRRAMFEGFAMSFLTVLNRGSEMLVLPLLERYLLKTVKNRGAFLNQVPQYPNDGRDYVRFKHYWIIKGPSPVQQQPNYIITPFVERNLLNLVRATSTRRFPVLLQGPTSSGKTSLVEYLAKISGNIFVRINNHEHTDLQEYLGTYLSGPTGQLQYQEGILVRALREGHWIVLDELNLAPSDILEALNRLLDDNRQLLLPETQEVIHPHENFMLFATQNPPGLYGGRKVLSRAFRNRFLELHFDDIPEDELETILRERSQIAPSFCTKIVTVYKKLAVLRQSGRLFERHQSFATLRDLFRWALRNADNREQLAVNGYMLLAERVRDAGERSAVKNIIEEVMKIKIDASSIYDNISLPSSSLLQPSHVSPKMVWTRSMRRLYTLITLALEKNEPVLLVGDTGCGKTSICQVITETMHTRLHIVNAHQNTETGDLIGAQRPIRNKAAIEAKLLNDLSLLLRSHALQETALESDLPGLINAYRSIPSSSLENAPIGLCQKINEGITKMTALFEWSDGSLVRAMKAGHLFLLDEISLADDSVLERVNSVLEPNRTILLAEKGSGDAMVVAASGFQFLATMNPGGDYGKRELSPALRNRFTEIWVPAISEREEILDIVEAKINSSMARFAAAIVDFAFWFNKSYNESCSVSIREILTWVDFVNTFQSSIPFSSLLHGAAMVYIDALGANPTAKLSISSENSLRERHSCLLKLSSLFQFDMLYIYNAQTLLTVDDKYLNIGPFEIEKVQKSYMSSEFCLAAPTVQGNIMRVVRALQLCKPILIEGSPGVGKTTLVTALAQAVGMPLTRINLSEQTDVMDLFGSDVPVEGGNAGQFAWRDAPFLQAMQNGEWVLLDEMNLASQSILESLNACLDHRGQVYVPELDQSFLRHPRFVVFAAQNPHHQGGGRKGLPASFVNRFTVVYADLFTAEDFKVICRQCYPRSSGKMTDYLIEQVTSLSAFVDQDKSFGLRGGPWEFNLRDILRWHHLLSAQDSPISINSPAAYQGLLFLQRLRSREDVAAITTKLLTQAPDRHALFHNISPSSYQVGLGLIARNGEPCTITKPYNSTETIIDLQLLESMMLCVQNSWPCLLVGTSGTGKSHIIRHLATRSGADLLELSLTTDMDTMDLIGGYEQTDKKRHIWEFMKKLRNFLSKVTLQSLESSANPKDAIDLLDRINASNSHDLRSIYVSLSKFKSCFMGPEYAATLEECRILSEKAVRDDGAYFEWVDGILVEALKQGKWLLLDNANLCGASVLDRLNSLLEPNGVLTINEHHSLDSSAEVVKPHPGFQLFLTMDPRYGELSRAMRNRCVELFVSLENNIPVMKNARSSYESSVFRYQPFQTIKWKSLNNAKLRDLAAICIDHLAFVDFRLCHRWLKQAKIGLLDILPSQLSVFSQNFEVYTRLLSQKVNAVSNIWHFYQSAVIEWSLLEEFCLAQTIHPLNNPAILPLLIEAHPLSQPALLAVLLETTLDLELLKHNLIDCRTSLAHKSTSQLSRLERSIAADSSVIFSKDSTQPLASYFWEISQGLLESIEKLVLDGPNCQRASTLIREIAYYISDMLDFTALPVFDESAFQVYLKMGKSLVVSCQKIENLRGLGRLLDLNLSRFNASWSLSTGISMEFLWEVFKPRTAKNIFHLQRLLHIENLADRFDRILWRAQAPIETLAELRQSLVSAYLESEPIDDELGIGFENVERALVDSDISIESWESRERPYFQDEFEGLCQYSIHDSRKATKDLFMYNLLSGRVSRDLLHLNQSPTAYDLLIQVPRLTATDHDTSSLMAVRNVLPTSICMKTVDIATVSLGALDLLHQEFRLLASGVADYCESISTSHIHALNSDLIKIYIEVLNAHKAFFRSQSLYKYIQYLKGYPDRIDREIPELQVLTEEEIPWFSSGSQLRDIVNKYFDFSVRKVREAGKENEQISSSAAAWISFFTGCLLLYVPDRQNDPALKPFVERSRYDKRMEQLQDKLEALKTYENLSTGQSNSLRYDLVEGERRALGDRPQVPSVARPEQSELAQLQGDFTNILTSIVSRLTGGLGLQDLPYYNLDTMQEAKLVRKNITQMVLRLSSHYRAYDDITKPVVGFLRGLDVGFALGIMVSISAQELVDSIDSIAKMTPLIKLEPETLGQMTIKDFSSGPCINKDHGLAYLRLATLARNIGPRFNSGTKATVLQVFHTFFEDWKEQLEADRTEHMVKSSVYRYRGGDDVEEEFNEREFTEIFPDYNLESSLNDRTEGVERNNSHAQTWELADCHYGFFRGAQDPSYQICTMLEKATNDIALGWKNAANSMAFPMPAKTLLPGTILILDSASHRLSHRPSSDRSYNFYVDANIQEGQSLVSLIRTVQTRFRVIKKAWPDHETLGDVIRMSNELLAFHHTSPLAKLLAKMEKLHEYIHEWQLVASREYSVNDVYDRLTDLIVGWRRLELSTWARLLDLEDEKCQKDAKSWWFVAYEVIIAVPLAITEAGEDPSRHVVDLLGTLGGFLHSTLMGQYSQRLLLIEQFKDHLELLVKEVPAMQVVHTALSNFVCFYTRFEPQVQEILRKGRQGLEKDMKEILLLASWKDTNINALRESAKRSHHKLFKIVRKYRSLLAEPSENVITLGIPRVPGIQATNTSSNELAGIVVDSYALQVCHESLQGWASKPSRSTKPVATAMTMSRISRLPDEAIDCSLYIESYTSNLTETMKILQKETPSKLDETNKEVVKHLRSRKRKLFADTLKDLRSMGLTSNLGTDKLKKQASLPTLFASMSVFPKHQSDFQRTLDSAEYYFHQTLSHIMKVREQGYQHSQELTSGEFGRSLGYLEGIIHTILRQRTSIIPSLTGLNDLSASLALMQFIWPPNVHCLQKLTKHIELNSNSIRDRVKWLPPLLTASCTIIQIRDKMGNIDSSVTVDALCGWKDKFTVMNKSLESLPTLPTGLSTSSHFEIYKLAQNCLEEFHSDLEKIQIQHPELSFILEKLKPWVVIEEQPLDRGTNSQSPVDIGLFDEKLSAIVDSMLVGVQNMHGILRLLPSSDKESAWLLQSEKLTAKIFKTLHAHHTSSSLQEVLLQLQHLTSTGLDEIKIATALCAIVVPIVQQYRNILRDVVHRQINTYRSLCKMAYVLTATFDEIVKNGFCSPPEKSIAEDGNTEKVEGGTGLGDGEGAEDISKDIQEDEDLSELAEQGVEMQEQEDIEDQSDAVDMQHDELKGQIGDDMKEAEDDGEKSISTDADNEMEEEVGDVDELDPSAVDEKIWNGADDTTGKGKEDNQFKGEKEDGVAAQDESNENLEVNEAEGEADNAGDEENEKVEQEAEKTDPHVEEGQNLNLPEEMELDGDRRSISSSDTDDMKELSDLDQDSDHHNEADAFRLDDSEDEGSSEISGDQIDPGLPEPNDENDMNDINDTNDVSNPQDTGSPVDTEPEEVVQAEGLGFLSDRANEAVADAAEGASSDTQRIFEDTAQPNDTQQRQRNGVKNSNDLHLDSTEAENAKAAGKDGETSREVGPPREMQGQSENLKESTESQAFKKLGDALEKWHRQRQRQIRDSTDISREHQSTSLESNNLDQDFEHVPNEDATADTQALGAATEDQAQALDKRALDSEMSDQPSNFLPEDPHLQEIDESEQVMQDPEPNRASANILEKSKSRAMIHSNNKQDFNAHQSADVGVENEEEIDDLHNNLLTVHLESIDQSSLRPVEDAHRLWSHYENLTRDLSLSLTEQLRLILAPTLATKMRGDFRTGKRLNIKRIIPYIASQYKRDKIWMRRSIPSKRNYQVMLAVDDSKSMGEGGSGELALETLALISKSLSMLEVGQICAVSFGDEVHVAHEFEQTFSSDAGVNVFRRFTFQQKRTNVRKLIAESISLFRQAKSKYLSSAVDLWQLELIISDGICEDHEYIRRLVRQAYEERIMIVFVIVDALKGESVMDMTQATFEPDNNGETKLKIKRYLDNFPFDYYLIVGNVKELPGVLATALRQWFAEVAETG